MNGNDKENIIIVKSDPCFEWERKAPSKKKGGAAKAVKRVLAAVLVTALAFSGAVGGMFVYDQYIAEDKPGGVVIQQQSPSPVQTNKPAPSPSDKENASGSAGAVQGNVVQGDALTASEVYEKVLKSTVLFICETDTATNTGSGSMGNQFGFDFNNPFGQPQQQPQQPQVSTSISYGSGIIMSADGYIMTNAHVVDGVTRINVELSDGKTYQATLIGSDVNTDIAVVKVEANGLPAATFADSSSAVIGQDIYVVGNPLGAELSFSLTCGNISSVNREIAIEDTLMTLMQVDAAVNPGNSGGPMANNQGLIVGVVNAKIVDEDVEGIGFAIPSNIALNIATELITHGKVASRPMLGITVESVNYEYAMLYKDQAGITVAEVGAGTCAEKAGIKVGDKITHFNGVEVWCNAQLNFQKEKYKIGDTVTITVEREGQVLELTVVLTGSVN